MPYTKNNQTTLPKVRVLKEIVTLYDGLRTTVHTARYPRSIYQPEIVAFNEETLLLDWCMANEVNEAINGGFFLRSASRILGDVWIDGIEYNTEQIATPWNDSRGCIYVDSSGFLDIGPRIDLPRRPETLLQAGPILVTNGKKLRSFINPEGISSTSHQFDTDISIGRYPRCAIGLSQDYIWSIACDGRSKSDAGMTFEELADYGVSLGAQEVLNLDGGGSATLISGGKIKNKPRGDGTEYARGRPIFTAIVFKRLPNI